MIITRRVLGAAVAGLLVLAGASSVAAQTYVEKSVKGPGTHHVIITVTPGYENEVIDTLTKHGASVKSQHPSINGVAADINGSDVSDLSVHGAATITNDWTLHSHATTDKRKTTATTSVSSDLTPIPPTSSSLRLTLGLADGSQTNLSGDQINGNGVGIAIIDSGLYVAKSGSDFDGRVVGWKDFVNGRAKPYDDFGHGTHVAGLIASSGALSNYAFQGVAPRANLVVLKVLDANGASSTSRVIAAIDYAIAHRAQLGIQVINLSLGHPVTTPAKFDPLVQAVEKAAQQGIVVVVAAGNDGPGYGSIDSPGNAPSAITVGAADGKVTIGRTDDYVPYFSSRGPSWYDGFAKPDVIAQGVNLFSDAAPNSTLVNATPAAWKETVGSASLVALSGTSMAAAVATGVVALELDANAHQYNAPLTANTAKAILEFTAIPVALQQVVDTVIPPTPANPNGSTTYKLVAADALSQGTGQINAAGATSFAGSINTLAKLNTNWLTAGVSGASTIGSNSYSWSDNIIWGTNVFSGNFMFTRGLMFDDNIIWGTGVLKGTTLVNVKAKGTAGNIIWGTNITGARNVVWGKDGDNIIWGTSLAPFRVIGQRVGGQIVWYKDDGDNIIWGTDDGDNIIWGTDDGDNIIWGTWDGDNIIWGTTKDANIVWGTSTGASDAGDNIIWGTSANKSILKAKDDGDNIIWGTVNGNIVVKSKDGDNIIWGTADGDNIIWGTADDNIIWGTGDGDNIIWGTADGDNIIWGTSVGGRK